MADARRFELEDLLIRPGTYFNPQTEILVVVDDSPVLDREIFDTEELEGAEWVLVSDEIPMDEARRDEALERFEVAYRSGAHGAGEGHEDEDGDEDEDEDDDLEPDEEPEDE